MTPDALTFRAQLEALRPELLRRARRMGARSAEDVVHDVMVRALESEGGYTTGTNLRAWLHRILYSVFVVRIRRRRHEHRGYEELRACEASWPHGDTQPEMLGLSPPVLRAFQALPAGFAAAVLLIDLGDRSCLEAAAELGIPPGTLMSRLHRGRRLLAAQLEESRHVA